MATIDTKPQSTPNASSSPFGITITGLVNDVRATKSGKGFMVKVSTDSTFITVFSKNNGTKVGDQYHGVLRGLSVGKYGDLSAFEEKRLG